MSKNVKKDKMKYDFYIDKKEKLGSTAEIDAFIKSNKNFVSLLNSFNQDKYLVEELKDIAEQDLKHINAIIQSKLSKEIDTEAVRSRIVLTKISLKRLLFLLNKKEINRDTIQHTYDYLVKNMNAIIKQMKIYARSKDEFDEIINLSSSKDSIDRKNKQDRKTIKLPNGRKIRIRKAFDIQKRKK